MCAQWRTRSFPLPLPFNNELRFPIFSAGSGPPQVRFPKFVMTFFAEIGARVAKMAGGFVLGSMAKAWLRMSVAQAS